MKRAILFAASVVGMVAIAAAAAVVGDGARAGAAPNLVVNGNFDSGAAGWTAAAGTNVSWNGLEDGDLRIGSGAGVVTWPGAGGGDSIASECIAIGASGAGNYKLAASYKIVAGGSDLQTAGVDVTVFADAGCSGDSVAHPSGELGANGGWLTFNGTIFFVASEQSMKLELVVHAVAPGDGVFFDKVALSNGALDTPTPPGSPTATFTSTPTVTNTPTATSTPAVLDTDGDGVPDVGDNCPLVPNAGQLNTDAANHAANRPGTDGLGDACDADIDGDGYSNVDEGLLGKRADVYCDVMRADVGGDHSVSILDIATLSQFFLQHVPPAPERFSQDGDAAISIFEFAKMSTSFLKTVGVCP